MMRFLDGYRGGGGEKDVFSGNGRKNIQGDPGNVSPFPRKEGLVHWLAYHFRNCVS